MLGASSASLDDAAWSLSARMWRSLSRYVSMKDCTSSSVKAGLSLFLGLSD
jgi:hypothetical protein